MRSGRAFTRALLVALPLLSLGCAATPERRVAAMPPPPSPRLFPTTDSDHDGVLDALDACPTLPGVASAAVLLNGCPPPGYYDDGFGPKDRDGDGIEADADRCPEDPGAAEWAGCPGPPDADGDGLVDGTDACPRDAGTARPDPRVSGCPTAWVDAEQIRIAEALRFSSGSAELLEESGVVLDALAALLTTRTELAHVRVEGHTDSRGGAVMNRRLGQRRAARVVAQLVARGVAITRLEAAGIGPDRPLDTNDTDSGRATNRRVEFHVEGSALAPIDGHVAERPPKPETVPLVEPASPAPIEPGARATFPPDPSGL